MQRATTGPELKQAETLFHLAPGDAPHYTRFARAIEDALSELFLPFRTSIAAADRGRFRKQYADLLAALEAGSSADSHAAIRVIHDDYWSQLRRVPSRAA